MAASLNPYISHFDQEFDAEKSSHYRLAIQCSLGGLSYAFLDTETQTLVALECYQSDLLANNDDLIRCLERALEAKKLNNKAFQSVTFLVDERINLIIPESIYQSENNDKLLGFGFTLPQNHSLLTDRLDRYKAVNLFALSNNLQGKLKTKWPELSFHHSSSVFLKSLPQNGTPTVFVNVRNRNFDTAIKDDQLLFFNNFVFNTKDDFAYFLLFAMEQNGCSGQDTTVCFSGLILSSSEIIDLCGRYVKDIRFVDDPQELQVSQALREVPFQYYHLLYQALR